MSGILESLPKLEEKKIDKKTPTVYHLVWDRKDKKSGAINPLSELLAESMTKAYGRKFDAMNLDTGVIKAFVESLLRGVLKK